MARVVWPEKVTAEVDDIADYIEGFDPAAAADIASKLFALGESLAWSPHRGRPAPKGTREMTTVWPYVLRYRVDGEVVTIVHVCHGRRRPV